MTVTKIRSKASAVKELLSEDRDFLKPLIKATLQEVLEAEMSEALAAEKGERTEARLGYRSGYYSRFLIMRIGKLELKVPLDRQGRFSTELFERYQRSEKALVAALAEMYVQGVSTRKVKLKKAVAEVFSGAFWQRCYVHFLCRADLSQCRELPSLGSRALCGDTRSMA